MQVSHHLRNFSYHYFMFKMRDFAITLDGASRKISKNSRKISKIFIGEPFRYCKLQFFFVTLERQLLLTMTKRELNKTIQT